MRMKMGRVRPGRTNDGEGCVMGRENGWAGLAPEKVRPGRTLRTASKRWIVGGD